MNNLNCTARGEVWEAYGAEQGRNGAPGTPAAPPALGEQLEGPVYSVVLKTS